MYGFIRLHHPNATWLEADELNPHRLYKSHVFNYDIGLIKLKENIVFGSTVKAIKLPTSDDLDSIHPAVASGWGRVHVSG